jgi:outer membrane receptor for ferrienterochelin and colicin
MSRVFNRLGFTAVAIVAGAMPAMAQGTQTGNIAGTVKDAGTGKGIASARVILSTPQGDRQTVTDAKGAFRFALLIPGPVTIKVTADGFIGASVTSRVNLGDTNLTEFPLKSVKAAGTTVEVLATANNIDTTDAKTGQTFALDAINDLPIQTRDVRTIASLAPGISQDNNGLTIRGAQNTQVLYLVDGADVADPVTGGFSAQLNEDMLSDVQVLTGGISAEYGRFTGGVVNTVTKSGSNEFSGVIRLTATDPNWNAYNPLGRTSTGTYHFPDYHSIQQNIVVSGPIIKDHLFFVVGYRAQAPFANSTAKQTTADPVYGGGQPYVLTQTDDRKDIKLDWQINSDHRVFWQYNKTEIDQAGRDYGYFWGGGSTSLATLSNQPNTYSYYTLGYQGQLTSSMLLTAHYGYKKETLGGPGGGGQGGQVPVMVDNQTGNIYDNGPFGADGDSRPIQNGSISLLNYLQAAGEHELKVGLDWYQSSHAAANSQSPTNGYVYFNGFNSVDANGNPTSTALSNRVFDANSAGTTSWQQWVPVFGAKTKNTIQAAYVNDKWKLNSNWSFNAGLRMDNFKSTNDLGTNNYNMTTTTPRLAAIWDMKGDGSWVYELSYGEYAGQVLQGATDGSSVVGNPAEYDYAYVGGDGNLRSSYSNTPFKVYDPALYRHSNLIDSNLKMPTMQEVSFSVKHADSHNGMWSVAFSRRRWKNFVDDFYSEQANPVDANDLVKVEIKNDPTLWRTYQSIELQFQQQTTEAFSWGGNVTFSELRGNYEGGQVGSTEQINNLGPLGAYAGSPTRAQLAPNGNLVADVPVRARITGNYVVHLGAGKLNFGGLFLFTSGAPYSKTASAVVPSTVGSSAGEFGPTYTKYFADRGDMRYADTSRFDLQIAYELPVWKKATFFAQLNLVNALNHQELATWNTSASIPTDTTKYGPSQIGKWTPGASYGTPTTSNNFIAARTVQLSAGVKF